MLNKKGLQRQVKGVSLEESTNSEISIHSGVNKKEVIQIDKSSHISSTEVRISCDPHNSVKCIKMTRCMQARH